MKKYSCMFLSVLLILTLLAGCAKGSTATTPTTQATAAPETTVQTTAPAAPAPAPLELLEKVWASYGEEERFPLIGGDMEAQIMDAPGQYDMKFKDNLVYMLLVPQEQLENIDKVATMIHMMNANSFTCGVFKLTDGGQPQEFADAMKASVLGNQWMCGFPDQLWIGVFGDDTVLVAYGVEELMGTFTAKLTAAYGDEVQIVAEERIE